MKTKRIKADFGHYSPKNDCVYASGIASRGEHSSAEYFLIRRADVPALIEQIYHDYHESITDGVRGTRYGDAKGAIRYALKRAGIVAAKRLISEAPIRESDVAWAREKIKQREAKGKARK